MAVIMDIEEECNILKFIVKKYRHKEAENIFFLPFILLIFWSGKWQLGFQSEREHNKENIEWM